jgi:ankyrin repeat protein
MHSHRCVIAAFSFAAILAAWVGSASSQAPPKTQSLDKETTPALIDNLKDIADGDVGYMPTRSGSGFLPLGVSQTGTLLLFQGPPTGSQLLRELVKRGAAAVPHLIAHLDDKRTTKIAIKHKSIIGGMFFDDEYDYNFRTATKAPAGVNRRWSDQEEPRKHPSEHTVTVGDLCFVALGQIVNRSFSAVRYQPTACIMINSPTYSEALRTAIKKEWGGLTPERHKLSLIRDFVDPDSEYRRSEACLRLGFYYPEALEPLALKQLAEPRYDVFEVQALIREKLYRTKDGKQRKATFDAFMAKRGEVTRQGILLYLFGDLSMQEADEEGRISPRFTDENRYKARDCLIELFDYPKTVKSKDQPWLLPVEHCTQARFIDTLAFFPSAKIDQAVRRVLHATDQDYLAQACARYLVGRGADEDIRKYVVKHRKGANTDRREELQRLRERIGWTPLHVAAEKGESDKLETLIRAGADINARAANGQTALHIAASSGQYGIISLLLDRKANPNVKDKQGTTPVQLAIGYDASAVRMLVAAGADPSDIFVASLVGRADLVKDFLQKDKNLVKARAYNGMTALHYAAQHGHVAVAEVLLARGADANAIDNERNKITPLHWAAGYAGKEMVALLLTHKADPNAKDWNNRTPLSWARDSKKEEVIPLLEK